MRTIVKICGVTNVDAIAAAVAAGARAIGFVFAASVRQVSPERAATLAQNVPADILRVAVMKHPDKQDWADVLDGFRPDVLQTDLADFDYLDVPAEITRWPVIREGMAPAVLPAPFIYEGKASGAGDKVDWGVASGLSQRGQMILAGGLNAGNVGHAIQQVAPFGVDVSSALESEPGHKDPQKIRDFIAAVRRADEASGDNAQ